MHGAQLEYLRALSSSQLQHTIIWSVMSLFEQRTFAVDAGAAFRYPRITSTKLILEMEGKARDHIEGKRISGMARRMKTRE
jgi:hypothetical protein